MKLSFKKCIALVLVLMMGLSLFACNFSNQDTNDNNEQNNTNNNQNDTTVIKATTLVTLEINPSIELTLDKNGAVASVYGANEDGQILLYSETENLIGKDYETAIEYITNIAIELGYLNENTETVTTSVTADSADIATDIQNKISAKIQAIATETGIEITIDTSDPFSLLCELEEFKAKYSNNENIQSITPKEFKLALILSERENVSVIAALEYDSDKIIEKIHEAHGKLEAYATDDYLKAKEEAIKIFDSSMGIVLDGVYNEVYMENVLSHINTFYYGAIYQAYKTTARTYRSVYDIKEFAHSMKNYEVDEQTINEIAEELGIKDTSVLEDKDGKVTIESLIEFSDKFIRQNEVPKELKNYIATIIFDSKNAAELANKGTNEVYKNDMAALKTQISTIISAINNASSVAILAMNDSAKAEFEACLSDLNSVSEKIDQIIAYGITESELEMLISEAEIKAEEMLKKIENDLSEEQLTSAKAKAEQYKTNKSNLTEEFNGRLSLAESEAKNYIENKRNELKDANKK